jgi:SAM-dependent methyltransferase
VIAPDGSPVALYRRLGAGDEAALVHGALAPAAHVLDLGCGAGRLAHALRDLAHPVTAVDQSAAMLAHVRGCRTLLADIETLDLGERFGGVLLASNLVNTHDEAQRAAFLATSRRHVAPDGAVVLQRLDPSWATTAQPFSSERDGVRFTFADVVADGTMLAGEVTYEFDDERCVHRFSARVLDDAAFDAALASAGLVLERWLDERRTWARAVTR